MKCRRAAALSILLTCATMGCAQPTAPPPAPPLPPVHTSSYPWLADMGGTGLPAIAPLAAVYEEPAGCHRVAVAEESFAAWMRGLPVLTARDLVHDHRGRPIPSVADHVILLDVGAQDLQQCADTLIRLHAEYLWASGQAARAAYHYTSGDLSSWADWQSGVRLEVSGPRVRRSSGSPRTGDHHSFRTWLQRLFVYAGTMSLHLDSRPVSAGEELAGGDFFVDPGSPGHAVMVLDVVESGDGRRFGLVGQGFTPAQELHVIGAASALDGVWFELPANVGESLTVPSWTPFPRQSARRFSLREGE